MKKTLLLFILFSILSFAQKKELMVGNLSKMDLLYDYDNKNYYLSDLQKNKSQIENLWGKSNMILIKDGVQVIKEFVTVEYLFKNNITEIKTIKFQNFSDFFYCIQEIIKTHPEINFEKTKLGNKYTIVENDTTVIIGTSFYYFENLRDNFDFDTIFTIEFSNK